jgi:Holliday junction DNA helicase RuvB
LDYYSSDELAHIVRRSARLLETNIEQEASVELASRSRGTPRVANRLLRRVRDFADVLSNGFIDIAVAQDALHRLDVDSVGLEEMDRRFLRIIIEHYKGGPVGIETLAAALSEPRDTLEDVYEPYLIQKGLLSRTARGRVVTEHAYAHLNLPLPPRLF